MIFIFYLDVIKYEKNFFKVKKNKRVIIKDFFKYVYMKYIRMINIHYIKDESSNYGLNVENLNYKIKIDLYNLNKRSLKKLDKILNIVLESNVCLSKNTFDGLDSEYKLLKDYFEYKNINISNANNKLFRIMFTTSIDKIVELVNLKKENIRIGILVDEITHEFLYNLDKIILDYKEVVIMTNTETRLEKYKNEIYQNKGIVLNVNNRVLFLKSDIVINYSFKKEKEVLNDEFIFSKCIYLNYDKDFQGIKILEGIEINDFILNYEEIKNIDKYKKYFDLLENSFNFIDIYQSLILKNTIIRNMLKEINNDNVKILEFQGKNGIIDLNEFNLFGDYMKKKKKKKMSKNS